MDKKPNIHCDRISKSDDPPRTIIITLCFLVPSSHYQRALTRSEGNDDNDDDDSVGCVDNVIYGPRRLGLRRRRQRRSERVQRPDTTHARARPTIPIRRGRRRHIYRYNISRAFVSSAVFPVTDRGEFAGTATVGFYVRSTNCLRQTFPNCGWRSKSGSSSYFRRGRV